MSQHAHGPEFFEPAIFLLGPNPGIRDGAQCHKSTGLGVRRPSCYYRLLYFLTVRTSGSSGPSFLIDDLVMIMPPDQKQPGDHRGEKSSSRWKVVMLKGSEHGLLPQEDSSASSGGLSLTLPSSGRCGTRPSPLENQSWGEALLPTAGVPSLKGPGAVGLGCQWWHR